MTINHFPTKIPLVMGDIFEKKCEKLKKIFEPLSLEERYQTLMEMGRKLPPFPEEWKTADKVVSGCQSVLYLNAILREDKLFFYTYTDALISAGLAALLIEIYSGELPDTILTRPPTFIAELGLSASLSPSRSNGLANIHLRMKQEALKTYLIHK